MATADYAYEIKDEHGQYAKPPPALLIGFDWQRFHLAPRAGGLHDQPLLLLHQIRLTLNVYDAVKAYREANNILKGEALSKWFSTNGKIVRLLEYIWKLQGIFTEE